MEFEIQSKAYYNIYDLLLVNKTSDYILFLKKIKKKMPSADKLAELKLKISKLTQYEQSKLFELSTLLCVKDFKNLTDEIILSVQKIL